ncbi:ABC transporter [Alteriqipengyuania flavescens]|uniref:DUF4350 domain-containing protein n=1 Tax=Alteriqipengyuania flavescens TaxID=3053610 RepID=UPI0025B5C372|nr:DUF4350 domain-containing protein [Alteriqipengyuania flavescens]WJY19078.1 ABC transporter [Alteriqipengyuania flavescens]WJY25019.1 ABC transporter [Alteriqipengyuania flavescens]
MLRHVAALLLAALSTPALAQDQAPAERPALGVFTTLPLAWGEASDLGAVIRGETESHWLRGALDAEYTYVALDTLDEELAGLDYLLMAQPRGLGGAENVALDDWVRGGGRLLLFADPMMTGESHYGIGDRRRPQDVALLSPILARWGLTMTMDEAQESADGKMLDGTMLPVALYGTFALRDPAGGAPADCTLSAEAVVAECTVGEGRVVILADAAMLDPGMGEFAGVRTALAVLLGRAFAADSQ